MAIRSEAAGFLLSRKPVLGIETATPVCSVAMRMADGTLHERSAEGKGVHSELTFVFMQELLSQEGLSVEDLGAVIVSAGPGSYTGLRVASSAIKGLLFRTEVPLYACSTLGNIALGAWMFTGAGKGGKIGAPDAGSPDSHSEGSHSREQAPTGSVPSGSMRAVIRCDAVIDARRNHLYHQSWQIRDDGAVPVSEVAILELEEVLERISEGSVIAGTGVERLEKLACDARRKSALLTGLSLKDMVSARHVLAALGRSGGGMVRNMIKKVAPEHFEPYYYTGL